jgi:hypothetical protein
MSRYFALLWLRKVLVRPARSLEHTCLLARCMLCDVLPLLLLCSTRAAGMVEEVEMGLTLQELKL